ncbi:MAG: lysophospholipid acyltransferase family protein [Halanaerobium sp.]
MKDKLSILLYNLFKFITKLLPRNNADIVGIIISKLAYYLSPERRKKARANIQKALGVSKEEAEKLTREVYKNLGLNFAEFLLEEELNEDDIDQMVEFIDIDYLDQALKKGNGVILYTAHFGNWELLGAVLALKGYKINSIAREQNNLLFDKKINKIRRDIGIGIIPRGLAVRQAFKALKNNEIVAILGDQDARSKGWKLNFFDRPASTFPGAVQFAERTGAEIVPAFFSRKGWLKHQLKCYSPRKIEAGKTEQELKEELQSLVNLSEAEIKKSPADWMWLHKRWKTFN